MTNTIYSGHQWLHWLNAQKTREFINYAKARDLIYYLLKLH